MTDEQKVLSAADILAADDREMREIVVPEWNGKVYLRTISGAERDRFEAESFRQDQPNLDNLRARYLALTLVGEDGKPLFDRKQVTKLGEKSASVLDRLFTEAARMNAMSRSDVDTLLGNSEGDLDDSSRTA